MPSLSPLVRTWLVLACLTPWSCQVRVAPEASGVLREGGRRTPSRLATPGPAFVSDARTRTVREPEAQQFAGQLPEAPLGTELMLKAPQRLAPMPDGSLLISEVWASRVSRLSPDGRLHPFAGGKPYLVREEEGAAALGDDALATEGMLNAPTALATDARGNVLVCDWRGHRIRRIEASSALIKTVAGGRPPVGNLRALAAAVTSTPIAPGTQAQAASITHPHAVAFDAEGRCVFACREGLFRVEAWGGLMPLRPLEGLGTPPKLVSSPAGEVFAGYGEGRFARLVDDALVALPEATRPPLTGGWQLAATDGGRLVLLTAGKLHAFEAGRWRELMALSGVEGPTGLAATREVVWVSSEAAGQVWRCDPASGDIRRVAGLAFEPGKPISGDSLQLSHPSALAFDRRGRLLLADGLAGILWRRTDDDTYTRVAGRGAPPDRLEDLTASSPLEASIGLTTAITTSEEGSIFFSGSDGVRSRLREVTARGELRDVALPEGLNPLQAVRDHVGAWIISDTVLAPVPTSRVVRIRDGRLEELVPPKPMRVCYGLLPRQDGSLYFCDPVASLVYKREPDGEVFVVAGNEAEPPGFGGDGGLATYAQLNWPLDLALDAKGRLYIADAGNHRVRRLEALGGKIATLAGEGGQVFAGTAPEDSLREPSAVLLDASGNLLVADTGNNQIKRISKSRL
jgi:sugar lactone lactonase YvrE